MSRVRVLTEPPPGWDGWVAQGRGGPYQTSHYAAYWREMWGYKPLFLTAGEGERPSALLLAYLYSPLTRILHGRPWAKALDRLTRPFLRSVASRFGPVILDPRARARAGPELLAKAGSLAGPAKGRHFHSALQVYDQEPPGPELIQSLSSLGGRVVEGLTPVLKIVPDQERIWSGLHRQARKAVRQAEKQGLEVEAVDGGDEAAAARFIDLADQAKGDPSLGPALPRLTALHLAREGFSVRYFICRLEDRPVAGIGLHAFGGVASEIAAWTTEEARERRLAGGDALKWAVIQWCADSGVRLYDLMGLAKEPANPKEAGIARFKKKWSSGLRPLYSLRTRAALTPP